MSTVIEDQVQGRVVWASLRLTARRRDACIVVDDHDIAVPMLPGGDRRGKNRFHDAGFRDAD